MFFIGLEDSTFALVSSDPPRVVAAGREGDFKSLSFFEMRGLFALAIGVLGAKNSKFRVRI